MESTQEKGTKDEALKWPQGTKLGSSTGQNQGILIPTTQDVTQPKGPLLALRSNSVKLLSIAS